MMLARWAPYATGCVKRFAEATSFMNFEISYDLTKRHRVLNPEHCIVTFPDRDKSRQEVYSSLLTLRLVREDTLPEQVQVSPDVRDKTVEPLCTGEYVEFELLCGVNEASRQAPLRIAVSPVRINSDTKQREFLRIDLGRCVRNVVTDIIEDPKRKGKNLVRNRFWICVEVMRLVCTANKLDCTALDLPGVKPLEWVLNLVDEKDAEVAKPPVPTIQELARLGACLDGQRKPKKNMTSDVDNKPPLGATIEELARFVDGALDNKLGKPKKKKKKAKDKSEDARAEGPPAHLLTVWRDVTGGGDINLIEATDVLHFSLGRVAKPRNHLVVTPAHHVIAFQQPPLLGQPREYQGGLLSLRVVSEANIPKSAGTVAGTGDSVEFELLGREGELPAQIPFRFTTGPVRMNEVTGQQQSLLLDLGECVRWVPPDFAKNSALGIRLVRRRWWIGIDALKLMCATYGINTAALDTLGVKPLEFVACVLDNKTPTTLGSFTESKGPPTQASFVARTKEAPPKNAAPPPAKASKKVLVAAKDDGPPPPPQSAKKLFESNSTQQFSCHFAKCSGGSTQSRKKFWTGRGKIKGFADPRTKKANGW